MMKLTPDEVIELANIVEAGREDVRLAVGDATPPPLSFGAGCVLVAIELMNQSPTLFATLMASAFERLKVTETH